MNSLVIGDIEYNLPTDYTVGKWVELHKIGWDNMNSFMACAFDIPEDKIELLPAKQMELGAAYVYSLLYPGEHKNALKPLNFKELTLGQFIDLEMCVDEGKDAIIRLCNLILDEEITSETSITKVYDAYLKYINYRNLLYFNYKSLFDIDDEGKSVSDIPPSNKRNNAHVWYDLVMVLAGEDFLKINAVTERPVIEAFNYLAFVKDKRKKEIAEARKRQLQTKMR